MGTVLSVEVLGIHVDVLSMEDAVQKVCEFVDSFHGIVRRVVTANPEMVFQAQSDHNLHQLINSADLVTADGEGIVWAAKFLGTPLPGRVTGIDLVQALLPVANARKWRIFLLGALPGVAADAAEALNRVYPDIVFANAHGYFRVGAEEDSILSRIKEFSPQLLLVGLGAKTQEQWIAAHYQQLFVPVSIGVGGCFDVLSGHIKRAPAVVQRLKLEWLYRLILQPWRWKRQTNLVRFMWKVIATKIS